MDSVICPLRRVGPKESLCIKEKCALYAGATCSVVAIAAALTSLSAPCSGNGDKANEKPKK